MIDALFGTLGITNRKHRIEAKDRVIRLDRKVLVDDKEEIYYPPSCVGTIMRILTKANGPFAFVKWDDKSESGLYTSHLRKTKGES